MIVCWDINLEAAQETAKEVEAIGGKACAFHCDVSQQKDVELKAKQVKNVVPHIDIIINNAGIMPCHPFLSHSIQEIDRCIDINVKGCIWVKKYFYVFYPITFYFKTKMVSNTFCVHISVLLVVFVKCLSM